MPTLRAILTPAIARIAEDQRFAPIAAAKRAIGRIEALASEIDADNAYPAEYLVHRITGYRPRVEEIELIAGADVLGDLSALAESLAHYARVRVSDAPAGALDGAALAERWGVSRKTISRDRRNGLIAWRCTASTGGERLLFSPAAIEAHEERSGRVMPSDRPHRLSDAERAHIARRSGRYAAALGWSLGKTAGHMAGRLGRSPGAVRRAIEAHESALPEHERAFAPSAAMSDATRRRIGALVREGVPIARVARLIGAHPATVHRNAMRERVRVLLEAPALGFEGDPDRELAALESGAARTDLLVPMAEVRTDRVAALSEEWALDAQREERMALALAGLRRRAHQLARAIDVQTPPAHLVDRAETDLRWAELIRRRLVLAETGLLLGSIRERSGHSIDELESETAGALVNAGYEAVARALEGFDVSRGGRLAGRAALPVDRVVQALVNERGAGGRGARARSRTGHPCDAWVAGGSLGSGEIVPSPAVLAEARPADRSIAELRLGLGAGPPRTALEISGELGISAGAVWAGWRRVARRAAESAIGAEPAGER